jgi:phosphoribosylaminoimidazole-succinocarboxamide synthase
MHWELRMPIERGSLVREGKAKILYEAKEKPNHLIQYFKDDATAFNAQKKGTILGKGCINNSVSSSLFKFLGQNQVPTHFVEKLSDREMLVQKVEIIPVEVVIRNRAAGSILKRLGLKKGDGFKAPLVEFFFKNDELGDPLIAETHILHFGWATQNEIEKLKELGLRVNRLLVSLFDGLGIELIDFKLEFGRLPDGSVVLADEISPDGCRLWDKKTGEPMDKDRFRQDLGGVESAYQEVFRRVQDRFEVEK